MRINALMTAARDLTYCMSFSFENLVRAQAAGRGIRATEGYVTKGRKRKHRKKDTNPYTGRAFDYNFKNFSDDDDFQL